MDMETYRPTGSKVRMQVHALSTCQGEVCPVHKKTDHHMREWHQHWRSDRGIFERICPHGIGHPDPDQVPRWQEKRQEWQGVHGCDGCCRPPS